MGIGRGVFECPRTPRRLRSGPLGKLVEGFCNWLLERGFSRWTIRTHLFNVSHTLMNMWAAQGVESAIASAQEILRAF